MQCPTCHSSEDVAYSTLDDEYYCQFCGWSENSDPIDSLYDDYSVDDEDDYDI